jgi:benzoylformate decarboxylase
VPISVPRLMAAVKEALPPNAIVGNETVTGSADLMRTLEFRGPHDYYSNKGGGIGQALPGGIGLKLAHPDRPVIALSGDGSSLYTIQSLWTAAHHRIPVVFVILHNRTYRILKLNMNRYRKDYGIGGERGYPHLDLADPDVGYVKVAEGFGLGARRVTQPDEIVPALREAFASGRPYLVEAVIDGGV